MSEVRHSPEFIRAFMRDTGPFPFNDMNAFDSEDLEEAYRKLDAQNWIDSYRQPWSGPLMARKMCELVGIRLNEDVQMSGEGSVTNLEEPCAGPVTVNLAKYGEEPMLTLGHEVGHIYLRLTRNAPDNNYRYRRVEEFCELFGVNLALPLNDVSKISIIPSEIVSLSLTYGLRPSRVLYQLMRLGELPDRVGVRSLYAPRNVQYRGVVCRCCIERHGTCEDPSPPDKVIDFREEDCFVGGSCVYKDIEDS